MAFLELTLFPECVLFDKSSDGYLTEVVISKEPGNKALVEFVALRAFFHERNGFGFS